jgi:hypothetical protein
MFRLPNGMTWGRIHAIPVLRTLQKGFASMVIGLAKKFKF